MHDVRFAKLYVLLDGESYAVADALVEPNDGGVLVYLSRDEGKRTRTAHRCGVLPRKALDRLNEVLDAREKEKAA